MTASPIAEQVDRVRSEASSRDRAAVEWMRAALIYGVPLGALLLEADSAHRHMLHMSNSTPDWNAAHAKAEALTGAAWKIGETHEIAIRYLWGLWTPKDMHEWRVFRNIRSEQQVKADYDI